MTWVSCILRLPPTTTSAHQQTLQCFNKSNRQHCVANRNISLEQSSFEVNANKFIFMHKSLHKLHTTTKLRQCAKHGPRQQKRHSVATTERHSTEHASRRDAHRGAIAVWTQKKKNRIYNALQGMSKHESKDNRREG